MAFSLSSHSFQFAFNSFKRWQKQASTQKALPKKKKKDRFFFSYLEAEYFLFLFEVKIINYLCTLHIYLEGEGYVIIHFLADLIFHFNLLKSTEVSLFLNKMTPWKGHIALNILRYKIVSVDHEKDYKLHSDTLKAKSVSIYVSYGIYTFPIKKINTLCLNSHRKIYQELTTTTKENNYRTCHYVFPA